MTAILTAAEMRALEQEAIAKGEVTGLELMERAGRGVVEAILAEWPDMAQGDRKAVVLCGPGNNGGDGFVVARLLKERGWEVEVFLYGDAERLPPDAKANLDRWFSVGQVLPFSQAPRFSHQADLYMDALFGIGLARPLEGELFNWVADRTADPNLPGKTVAVDIPSGLCSDSGRELARDQETVLAGLTVTFHSLKPGHLLGWGPFKCGKVVVKDIGLQGRPTTSIGVVSEPSQSLRKMGLGHKYSHGHALLLSGGCGRGGAARLAARGALRIGAGLVTLAVPPAALQENAARLDAIMLRSVRDAGALADLLSDPRTNALLAGPGLGTGEREAGLLHALLDASRRVGQGAATSGTGVAAPAPPPSAAPSSAEASTQPGAAVPPPGSGGTPRAVVLDADALTLLAKDEALRGKLHDRCILTPHDGEFARLFPAIAERLNTPATTGPAYSKVDAARDAAREAGCVVLFKGPDTVIADPTGRAAINAAVYDRAAPWLATAGSGDVLAGMICGLLARGFAPFDAACTAAWLHVEAARSFGPGLIAEDLPEELPKVFRALGLLGGVHSAIFSSGSTPVSQMSG